MIFLDKGLLQGGPDGIKSLILRYQTLVETKNDFQQRDFSKEVDIFFKINFVLFKKYF
jgi:hypothetical protein